MASPIGTAYYPHILTGICPLAAEVRRVTGIGILIAVKAPA
jgi:hypothetical protein